MKREAARCLGCNVQKDRYRVGMCLLQIRRQTPPRRTSCFCSFPIVQSSVFFTAIKAVFVTPRFTCHYVQILRQLCLLANFHRYVFFTVPIIGEVSSVFFNIFFLLFSLRFPLHYLPLPFHLLLRYFLLTLRCLLFRFLFLLFDLLGNFPIHFFGNYILNSANSPRRSRIMSESPEFCRIPPSPPRRRGAESGI